MIDRIRQHPVPRFFERVHHRLAPHLVRRRAFQAALVGIVLAILYWGVIASDRYVSEADVVVFKWLLQQVKKRSILHDLLS